MLGLKPKLIIIGATLIGLIVFVYLWRGEIVNGAENAYKSILASEVIATTEQSKKDSDNVRKEEQSLDASGIDISLCALGGIVRGNKGCNSN